MKKAVKFMLLAGTVAIVASSTVFAGGQGEEQDHWIENSEGQIGSNEVQVADPKQIYEEAIQKNNNLNNYAAIASIEISQPNCPDRFVTADIKMKNRKSDNPEFLLDYQWIEIYSETDQNPLEDYNTIIFYKEGYSYLAEYSYDTLYREEKIKEVTPWNEMAEFSESIKAGMVLDSQYLTGIQLLSATDGKQVFSFGSNTEGFRAMASEMAKGLMSLGEASREGVQLKDFSGTISVDQAGYMTESEIFIKADISGRMQEIKIRMEYTDPGNMVTIDLPSAEGYEDVTEIAEVTKNSTVMVGGWQEDQIGWYWRERDGSFPASAWRWLDGNHDGTAECYYFDEQGYLMTNAVTPDGSLVDSEGRWTENGLVQHQNIRDNPADARQIYDAAARKTYNLNDYEATINVAMGSSAEAVMNVKMKNKNSYQAKYMLEVQNNLWGAHDVDTLVFYSDGYSYIKQNGLNQDYQIRRELSLDELMKTDYGYATAGMVWESQYLTDIWLVSEMNGDQTYAFTISRAGARATGRQLLRMPMGGIWTTIIPKDNFSGTVTINSAGYITESEIYIEDTKHVDGWHVHTTYINPGEPVDFSLPSMDGFAGI